VTDRPLRVSVTHGGQLTTIGGQSYPPVTGGLPRHGGIEIHITVCVGVWFCGCSGGWVGFRSLWVVEVFGVGGYIHLCVSVGVLAAKE
jgi:hypothetical protein